MSIKSKQTSNARVNLQLCEKVEEKRSKERIERDKQGKEKRKDKLRLENKIKGERGKKEMADTFLTNVQLYLSNLSKQY